MALVKEHESDIRRITAKHGGTVVKMLGDGSMLSFSSARGAARAAIDLQAITGGRGYAVRIGIHAGEVVRREGDLLGITVNKAARVASVAGAGQVLVSSLVAELVGPIEGVEFGQPETVTLKGLSGTHTLLPIEARAADRNLLATLSLVGIALAVADGIKTRRRLDDLLRTLVFGTGVVSFENF